MFSVFLTPKKKKKITWTHVGGFMCLCAPPCVTLRGVERFSSVHARVMLSAACAGTKRSCRCTVEVWKAQIQRLCCDNWSSWWWTDCLIFRASVSATRLEGSRWFLGRCFCVEAVNVINQSEPLKNKRGVVRVHQVTLLWEDQTRRHLLASARLYFLPEDTPKGRTREHGEVSHLPVSSFMWSAGVSPQRRHGLKLLMMLKAVTASLFLRVLIYGFKLALLLSCQLQLLVSHLFLVFISFLSSFYCASSLCPAPTRLWCQKLAVFTASFCSPPASNRNIWPFSYKPSACL